MTGRSAGGARRGLPARPTPARRSLSIDAAGIARAATQIPSPNCDERPAHCPITLVVIHGISLPPGEFGGDAIARLFINRLPAAEHPGYAAIAKLRVSAHFVIRRDGELIQFVACGKRAWHAGESSWRGRAHCNDYAIGIELEGTDTLAYAPAQYRVLAQLLRALRRRYPIADVTGHSDIAPGRKTDPGPAFDWAHLARLTDGKP